MWSRGKLVGAAVSAAMLAGCGSSSHTSTTVSSTSAGPTISVPVSPATGSLQTRTLETGELPGFRRSLPVVETNPQTWVAVDQLNPQQRASVAARLHRLGFVGAAREDLTSALGGPTGSPNAAAAGLSVVEQLGSAAGAAKELAAELPSLGPGSPIKVPGVPGARGFSSPGNGSDYANIMFADGPYVYLVGAEWQMGPKPASSVGRLIAAVQHLYHRTRR